MAFNPFITFQKNKRFWMAAILMVCMVTFVFCTGMRGDMQDRIINMIGMNRGQTVFTLQGRSVGTRDLADLKNQRNLANDFMKSCADYAFKNVSRYLFEENKKGADAKDDGDRVQRALTLEMMQRTLAHRKSRRFYFDTGTKFDELVEFKLWQAEADRLGIRIEEEHLSFLFRMECLDTPRLPTLRDEELFYAQQSAVRNSQNATNAMVRHAVAEEFRVRMAQLAVLRFQPAALRGGGEGGGFTLKFDDPNFPEETRGPVTLSQIWDFHKKQRAGFDVTLLAIDPKDWLAKMPEPTDFQKREFFDKNKDKPNDPSAEDYGLETPAKAKIEFLYADLKSPAYLELAKTLAVLKRVSPAGLCLMQTPLANAVRYVALAEQDFKIDLQRQYDSMTRNPVNRDRYHRAAYFSERDFATPVVEFYARKAGAESVASFLGAAMASSISPLEAVNAAAGHLAWGAMGRPASDPKIRDEEREKHEAGVMDALKSEARRRARVYADVASFFPLHQSPFDVMGPFMALDNDHIAFKVLGPGFRIMDHFPPRFTIETVESEIRGILAERVAEGWAQTNMEIVREKLSKATDAEQFKRELKVLIPKYKLTLGPTGDAKNTYYSRFTVGDAKELEVLKNAFETYVDMINMFEGRDMTPEKMLKSADFWKMFFGSEPTFTATGVYRAMAWPPEVEPNTARLWTKTNQRLINEKNVNAEEGERFLQHLRDTSPEKKPTNLDLFKTAGQPILFWRSSDISSKRQADYDGIAKELVRLKGDVAKLEEQFKKKADNQTNEELRKKQAEVKDVEDLQTRIVEGWKFDQARSTKAIPEAKELALSKLGKTNNFDDLSALANKMNLKVTRVRELSPMQPANNPGGRDYYEPSLPKDAIDFPRDDTVKNLLGLYNMQAPITIGYKELDDINRELFDKAKALNLPDGFAQILTNKPRSRFYVAFVTNTPKAERDDFQFAMKHAVAGPRDFFADRAQESDAQVYRQNFVAALKQRYNYSCDDETKARQEFDDIRRAPGE